jgi:hypothetical protein
MGRNPNRGSLIAKGYWITLGLSVVDLVASVYWRQVVGEFAYGFYDQVPNMPRPDPSRNLSGSFILWFSLGLVVTSAMGWIVTRERRWSLPLLASLIALGLVLSAERYTV